MNINNADVAFNYLYTKYLACKANRILTKSPKQIVEEPFLRNFYAGIKPSSYKYLYPEDNIIDSDFNKRQNHFKIYRKPIQSNKRLCPWQERKLPKFRNNRRKQNSKNKTKKYKVIFPESLFNYDKCLRSPINKKARCGDNKIYQNKPNILDQSDYSDSFPSSYSYNLEFNSQDDSKFQLDYYHICLAKYFFTWLSLFYKRIEIRKQYEENYQDRILKNASTMTNYHYLDGRVNLVTLKPVKLNNIIINEESISSQDESFNKKMIKNYEYIQKKNFNSEYGDEYNEFEVVNSDEYNDYYSDYYSDE